MSTYTPTNDILSELNYILMMFDDYDDDRISIEQIRSYILNLYDVYDAQLISKFTGGEDA